MRRPLHRVALGIRVAQGECLVHRTYLLVQITLLFVFRVACETLGRATDLLEDAARVISGRDVRRAVFREAAEKARRRRSHNDEAEERDAPIHGPPQMLPGAALLYWQPGAAARVRWAARRPDVLA